MSGKCIYRANEAWSRCHEILGIWLILFLQTCRKRKGRPRSQKVNHFICQGRFAIPSRSYRTLPQDWKVRFSYGSWCPSLPCCRLGILVRWNFGTCRKCCSWQQESTYHPSTHPTRSQKRRGIEQIARRCHHRCWWCSSKHPRCSSPKEERQKINCFISFGKIFKKKKCRSLVTCQPN